MTAPDPHAVAIGAAVRGAIAQAGFSQAEVSERIGIALNSFSRRVNGHLPFTWPELVRIASLCEVAVTDLAASAERIANRSAEAVPA